jgi:hypothetical protein
MDLGMKNWKELFCNLGAIRVCKDVILHHRGPQNFPNLEIPFQWVGGQDNVDSIVARIRAGGSVVRIPAGATKYSLVLPFQAIPGVHSDSYPICTRSFQGLTRPERNFDSTPPPSAEVRMNGSVHLLPTCLCGMQGRKTTFRCVLRICEGEEEIQLAQRRV